MTLARKLPEADRHSQAAGIAGLSFLACALIPILAQVSTLFRHYAPIAREWLIALSVQASGWIA